jgi:hypothetical protein
VQTTNTINGNNNTNIQPTNIETMESITTNNNPFKIQAIRDYKIKSTKEKLGNTKIYHSFLCLTNNNEEKWIPQTQIFDIKEQEKVSHLIQSNQQKHKDNIQKHFYQQQKKDTKYTTPSLMTPYIHLSTKKCNPNKDIQTTSPTIQIREDTANIYDAKRKHNGQVSRDRL